MKKIFLTLALLIACAAGFSQTANDFVNELKTNKGVEYNNFSKDMIDMMASKAKDKLGDKVDMLKNIQAVQILQIKDCDNKLKKNISKSADKLKSNGYEEMMNVKDEDDNVNIIGKTEGDNLHDILLLISEKKDNEYVVIHIDGTIRKDDLNKIISMKNNN